MASVEAVVIKEIANALNDYYPDPDGDGDGNADDDGYPWLSMFGDPAVSPFQSAVNTTRGHLPISRYQAGYNAGGDGFYLEADKDFTLQWNFASGGTFTESGASPLAEDCVRDHDCTFSYEFVDDCSSGGSQTYEAIFIGVIAPPFSGNWTQGRCRWSSADWNPDPEPDAYNTLDELTCETSYTDSDSENQIERSFTFALRGVERQISPADGTFLRRELFSSIPDEASLEVTVADRFYSKCDGVWEDSGSSTLTLTGAEANAESFELSMRLDLEVIELSANEEVTQQARFATNLATPGALPEWIWTNNWHHLVFVSYPLIEGPGDTLNMDCNDDGSCLTVSMLRPGASAAEAINLDDVRGVVVLAGADLDGTANRTVAVDFFEDDNADLGVSFKFTLRQVTDTFNDKLIILDPEEF